MSERERKKIGEKIAKLRNEVGISQRILADSAGINQPHLARIELGRYNVGIDTISRIASILDVDIDFIDTKSCLKRFVVMNKDRNDPVGDLCTDLLRDPEFLVLRQENEQRERIILAGRLRLHLRMAIKELFEEYSGEEICFED
ncbi:helix-turn-helix domain-containing protein [uncultured Parabacteroides sp.]|nr:helix-turn-helix domain-containing protein [uncultured Parabacteroides sp.]